MKKLWIALGIAAVATSNAAVAHDTTTAFASRGACESASAEMSNNEKAWLLTIGPQYFDTIGDAASFLTKAWTCDLNPVDGQYYITDHIQETLDSDWFAQRKH